MTANDRGLDQLSVNTIRALAIDTVQKANSGHPGLPLGAAPIGYSLFARTMRHNPANPHWPDRDRFVLSAGHGSALLYSLLHLTGYDLPLEQLKLFRQFGSQSRKRHGMAHQLDAVPPLSSCAPAPVPIGIGRMPSRENRARSASTSGLPVVSSLSP